MPKGTALDALVVNGERIEVGAVVELDENSHRNLIRDGRLADYIEPETPAEEAPAKKRK